MVTTQNTQNVRSIEKQECVYILNCFYNFFNIKTQLS